MEPTNTKVIAGEDGMMAIRDSEPAIEAKETGTPEPTKLTREQRRAKERLEKELQDKCNALVVRYKKFYNRQVEQVREAKIVWEGRAQYQKDALEKKLRDLQNDWTSSVEKALGVAKRYGFTIDERKLYNMFLTRIYLHQVELKKNSQKK